MLTLTVASVSRQVLRHLTTTRKDFMKKITEITKGEMTVIELQKAGKSSNESQIQPINRDIREGNDMVESVFCECVLCKIPKKVSYKDVLILEQFMRLDGTVLPEEITGLCHKQQRRLERCVMQAHWSGLFPDRTIPEFDQSGYKRFNRHWNDDLDMFRLKFKMQPGSWYYIKRYNPKAAEYKGSWGKTSRK